MLREFGEKSRGCPSPVVEYLLGGIGVLVILALAISGYGAIVG